MGDINLNAVASLSAKGTFQKEIPTPSTEFMVSSTASCFSITVRTTASDRIDLEVMGCSPGGSTTSRHIINRQRASVEERSSSGYGTTVSATVVNRSNQPEQYSELVQSLARDIRRLLSGPSNATPAQTVRLQQILQFLQNL